MSHDHHHDHGPSQSTPLKALSAALAVTGIVFFAELIGGWLSGSMALMADAMHMLSDAAGLIIAVAAVMAGRRQATAQATYGYRRIEVLAALVNAVTVIVISIFIVIEALRRLHAQAEVDAPTMLVIAVIGLVANALSAWILSRHREASVNVEGAFLHVVVDMLGSVAVIAAAVVIHATGFQAADVVASLIIACLVIPRAWQLLSNSAKVLLEQVPHGFEVEAVEPALRALDGVIDVHDLHLWSLDGAHVLATVHLVIADAADPGMLLDDAQHCLGHLGIDHSTIQLERPEHVGHEAIC